MAWNFHSSDYFPGIQPAFGVILSKVVAVSSFRTLRAYYQHHFLQVFQLCDQQEQEDRMLFYILMFVGLGVLMLFTMFLQVNL